MKSLGSDSRMFSLCHHGCRCIRKKYNISSILNLGCNTTKCGIIQGVWILYEGNVFVAIMPIWDTIIFRLVLPISIAKQVRLNGEDYKHIPLINWYVIDPKRILTLPAGTQRRCVRRHAGSCDRWGSWGSRGSGRSACHTPGPGDVWLESPPRWSSGLQLRTLSHLKERWNLVHQHIGRNLATHTHKNKH